MTDSAFSAHLTHDGDLYHIDALAKHYLMNPSDFDCPGFPKDNGKALL